MCLAYFWPVTCSFLLITLSIQKSHMLLLLSAWLLKLISSFAVTCNLMFQAHKQKKGERESETDRKRDRERDRERNRDRESFLLITKLDYTRSHTSLLAIPPPFPYLHFTIGLQPQARQLVKV